MAPPEPGQQRRAAVAAVLIEYGSELEKAGAAQVGTSFTGLPAADELLREDPNAFLLGVLFTQGIPAERAWAGPYLLRQRLGGLDLRLLAGRPDLVVEAVQMPPMLHRFKETLPRWISAAAARVIAEYQGDASRIWSAGTDTAAVIDRLLAFEGIGRKKAVMATAILGRHLGVELAGREHGRVAYDVQVRRVFLRSGLIAEDTAGAVEAAACEFSPGAPDLLDLPAWLIGRQTCRPRCAECDRCRLGGVCPRLVWLTPQGVGARSR